MLTKAKAKAWKKVIVMGISLSLSGFVPVMTTSYAFADENPEMVDITSENVYQIEEEDSQNMVNEPSEGLEKINLQAEKDENEGKNQEILVNDPHDKDMNEEVNNDVTSDEPEANNENVTEETFTDQESKDQEEGSDAQEENASYIIEEETETAEDTSDETSDEENADEEEKDRIAEGAEEASEEGASDDIVTEETPADLDGEMPFEEDDVFEAVDDDIPPFDVE